MNLYFILEGEQTEIKLYPKWIEFIVPELTKVDFIKDVKENNYYLFSGGGIPSIYNHVINAIKDINDNPVFDILVVCLDGDDIGVKERVSEAKEKLVESGVELPKTCEIKFIIQNICIETWFLGNKKIVSRAPKEEKLQCFLKHYNVVNNDPELMMMIEGYRTTANFHFLYLREIFKEHNLVYSKANPKHVLEKTYFDELVKRVTTTEDLPSLKYLFDFLTAVRSKININKKSIIL